MSNIPVIQPMNQKLHGGRTANDVIEVVQMNGVKIYRLTADLIGKFESYRFSDMKFRSFPYEGRQLVTYKTNPYQRLMFFYERSPYWDQEKNLYPVAKVTKPLVSG